MSFLRTLFTDEPQVREPSPPERGRGQGEGVGATGQIRIFVGRSS